MNRKEQQDALNLEVLEAMGMRLGLIEKAIKDASNMGSWAISDQFRKINQRLSPLDRLQREVNDLYQEVADLQDGRPMAFGEQAAKKIQYLEVDSRHYAEQFNNHADKIQDLKETNRALVGKVNQLVDRVKRLETPDVISSLAKEDRQEGRRFLQKNSESIGLALGFLTGGAIFTASIVCHAVGLVAADVAVSIGLGGGIPFGLASALLTSIWCHR